MLLWNLLIISILRIANIPTELLNAVGLRGLSGFGVLHTAYNPHTRSQLLNLRET